MIDDLIDRLDMLTMLAVSARRRFTCDFVSFDCMLLIATFDTVRSVISIKCSSSQQLMIFSYIHTFNKDDSQCYKEIRTRLAEIERSSLPS